MNCRARDVVQAASSRHSTMNYLYAVVIQHTSPTHVLPRSFSLHPASFPQKSLPSFLSFPSPQNITPRPSTQTLGDQRPCTTHLSHPSAAQRATTSAHARERRTFLHIPRLPAFSLRPCPCCLLAASTARQRTHPWLGDTELPYRRVGIGNFGNFGDRCDASYPGYASDLILHHLV